MAAAESPGEDSTGEYVMDLLNKPSITIEIGSSVAPCPHWQYEIEFQKNRYVVVRIANALK